MPTSISPRSSRAFRAVAFFPAVFLLLPSRARGEGPPAATAERLFQDARALITEKRYAVACPMLEESLRLEPAPGTEFNLARCYELDGRLASASRAYVHVAEAMRTAGQVDRERVARERVAQIAPHVPHLVFTVPSDDGLRVAIDGRELAVSELSAPVAIDPGDHAVSASAPGKRAWLTRVHVEADSSPNGSAVVVTLDAASPPPSAPSSVGAPPVSPRVVPPPASSPGLGTQRWAALGVGASAVVAAGVGAYFGVRAFQLAGDARTGCGSACDSYGGESRSDGDVSTVSFVVAGALAASGVVLWLTAPRRGGQGVVVAPGVSRREAIWVGGKF
jgi:hypothetical protein